jgi:alpha-L-rhamnosidase
VKASHKTLYGTIEVEWKQEKERFHLSVAVPVNTQATVILPNGKSYRTGSGRHDFEHCY